MNVYIHLLFTILYDDFPKLLREILKQRLHQTQLKDLARVTRNILPGQRFIGNGSEISYDDLDLPPLIKILKLQSDFQPLFSRLDSLRNLRNNLCHLPDTRLHRECFESWFEESCNIADDIEDYLGKPRTLSEKFLAFRNERLLKVPTRGNQTPIYQPGQSVAGTEFRNIETKLQKLEEKSEQSSNSDLVEKLGEVQRDLKRLEESLFSKSHEIRCRVKRIGKTLQPHDNSFENQKRDIRKLRLQGCCPTELNEKLDETVIHRTRGQCRGVSKEAERITPTEGMKNPYQKKIQGTSRLDPDREDVLRESMPDVCLRSQKPIQNVNQREQCPRVIYPSATQLAESRDENGVKDFKKHPVNVPNCSSVEDTTKSFSEKLIVHSTITQCSEPHTMHPSLDEKVVPTSALVIKCHTSPNKTKFPGGKNELNLPRRRSSSEGDSTPLYITSRQLSEPYHNLKMDQVDYKRSRKKDTYTCYEALGIESRTPLTSSNCIDNDNVGNDTDGDVVILHPDVPEDEELASVFSDILRTIDPKLDIQTQDTVLMPGESTFNVKPILNFKQIWVLITPFYHTQKASIFYHRINIILTMRKKNIVPVLMADLKNIPELVSLRPLKFYEFLPLCQPKMFKTTQELHKAMKK